MPVRPVCREQAWLLPPTLDDLIPADHPVRFVVAFVEALSRSACAAMGINLDGEDLGASGYDARMLLGMWIYGFITGIRSTRKLEAASYDQIPFLWLTGRQHPDHNTLWRFYVAHRKGMRQLLKRTIKTAMKMNLVDLAVQAVDGSKIAANAGRKHTYDAKGLKRLMERVDKAIADLEGQNSSDDQPSLPKLPEELKRSEALREQIQEALKQVEDKDGPKHVNLTDGDARLMKSRQGIVPGYNGQAMVSPLNTEGAGRTGLFITAADVTNDPDDHSQLVPMIEAARENTETKAGSTLGDSGFHSGANLAACERLGERVLMPEAQEKAIENPYHKEHFKYDAETDSYTCPEGQKLNFKTKKQRKDRGEVKVYRGNAAVCRACPAFGKCTENKRQGRTLENTKQQGVADEGISRERILNEGRPSEGVPSEVIRNEAVPAVAKCTENKRHGRTLEVSAYDDELRRHRAFMATEEAKELYKQRQTLPEPTFGIIKEEQAGRRFLLRGLENVKSEWTLLATAFNLRTLYRVWLAWSVDRRGELVTAFGG